MSRYRRRLSLGEKAAATIGVALLLAASHTATPARTVAATQAAARPSHAAAVAITYAKHQIGAPYVWGGTGPYAAGFDCSGLVMEAYASAGISIPRTSEDQWATLRHIPRSRARAGDLVFFAGSDGSWSAPGHVGLVTGPHLMLDAYGSGVPVQVQPFSDAGTPVGFARPGGA